ncbi:DUF4352 domain-containing protein, partial [Streptomyces sp. AS02]|nr:DUF4352 domain-containing protein [Streptomyces sp. AS02]
MPTKKPFYKKWWFIAIVVFFALGFLGRALGLSGEKTADKPAMDKPAATAEMPKAEPTKEADKPVAEPTKEAEK